jgi:type II secretory pathway component GspD/PulD (secretin)
MKRNMLLVAAIGLLLCVSLGRPIRASAQSSEGKGSQSAVVEKQKISIDLESSSLYYALKLLFSQVKANFTIDESLKSLVVTAHFTDVPFRTALETLLKSTSTALTYTLENGIYSVSPKVEEPPIVEDSNNAVAANISNDIPKIHTIQVYNVSDLDIVQAFGGTILNIGLIPRFGQGGAPAGQNQRAQQNSNGFFDQGENMIGTGHGKIIVVASPITGAPIAVPTVQK